MQQRSRMVASTMTTTVPTVPAAVAALAEARTGCAGGGDDGIRGGDDGIGAGKDGGGEGVPARTRATDASETASMEVTPALVTPSNRGDGNQSLAIS